MRSLLLIVCASLYFGVHAQPSISFQPVSSGLSSPVDIVEEKNDSKRLFIVQQGGLIRTFDGTSISSTPFINLAPVILFGGERGLLSMAFHPDYATNGYFFVWYNEKNSGDVTLARYSRSAIDPAIGDPASGVVLLQIPKRFDNHNGAKLNFGPDGYLYIGTGDGGSGGDPDGNGQDSTTLLAKLLRIDVNNPNPPYYSIPPTNPFAGSTTARKEIIALGLRNPWRWSFDMSTGDMWIADVGQDLYEEVNYVPFAGRLNKNYGWNCYEAMHSYANCTVTANNVVPVFEYGHDNSTGGHSITGGYVYRGTEYPDLQGYYLCADYISGNGWLIKPDGFGGWSSTLQHNWVSNITSFGERSDGTLYVVTQGGNLYKVVASGPLPVKLVSFAASASGDKHNLLWSVNNEQAGDEYIIERRTDASQPFAAIDKVKVLTSKAANNYRVQVSAPGKMAWYRLQLKGIDGNVSYSSIAALQNGQTTSFRAVIISNTLQVTLPPSARFIKVFDSNGKLLLNRQVTNSVAERISLQNIARGILAIQVQTDDGVETKQVLY